MIVKMGVIRDAINVSIAMSTTKIIIQFTVIIKNMESLTKNKERLFNVQNHKNAARIACIMRITKKINPIFNPLG